MPTLTYLTGRATLGTASTTPALTGLVNGGTLIVTVKAAGDSASTLGNPVITDTLGNLTYDDTPNALTSTIAKDANPDDTDRQTLTAIYTATVGADVTGAVTATVSNADVVRVDCYFVDGTVEFNDTDIDDNGALPIIPAVTGVAIDDWTIYVCAQSEYSIPSNYTPDAGTTTTYGSLGDGTTSSVSTVLRWRDVIRTDTTDGDVEFFYESGGGWSHTGSALSLTITGAIGGGGGGTGGNTATEVIPGVGLLIEAALDESDPLAESHEWTDLTCDGVSLTMRMGRQSELVAFDPGTARIDNITQDRSLDPDYAAGPYFGALLEATPARISATYNAVTYRMHYGFVQEWPQQTVGGAADVAISTPLESADAFSVLAQTAAPRSEYELRVLQDDPMVYLPLDDSVNGFTRDASDNDFYGELPSGPRTSRVAEFGGDGGVVGPYMSSALSGVAGDVTHTHPDGDVDIAAFEFLVDVGVNEFPDYSGSGTESYVARVLQIESGLASWVARITRTYSEAPLAGNFAEVTTLALYWTDGATERAATDIEIGRIRFSDVPTSDAAFAKYQKAIAYRKAATANAAAVEAARIYRNLQVWAWVEASTGRDASRTLDLARAQERELDRLRRDNDFAAEAYKAATVLASSSAAVLTHLDVARDDTFRPVHIVGRLTSGPTLQVWVDGELKASSTSTGSPGSAGVVANSVRVRLAPRGVPVGHVAVYDHDLDPQSILQHHVASHVGLGTQKTGVRARMVLHAIGWPEALVDIDDGSSYIRGIPAGSVLSYLQELAVAEQGRLFAAGDGKVTFRGRIWDLQNTAATTVQATLSDDIADTGSIWYSDVVTIPASRETIINEVVAVRDGGVLQRRAVPRSQRRTTHTASYAGLLLSNDQGVGNFATYLLDRYAVRQTRFAEVTIYPQHTRQTAATVWPFVFGVQPGWRVQVNRTPNDVGAELTQECFVEGVEHQFDAGGVWSTRLYLVPAIESADDAPWFTIGVSPTGIDPFHF